MNKVLFSSVGASVSIDKHDSILDALQKAKEASLPFDSAAHPQVDGYFEFLIPLGNEEISGPSYPFDEADGFVGRDEDPLSGQEYEDLINGNDYEGLYEPGESRDFDEDEGSQRFVSCFDEWEQIRFDIDRPLVISIVSDEGTEVKIHSVDLETESLESANIHLCVWNSLLEFLVKYRFITAENAADLEF